MKQKKLNSITWYILIVLSLGVLLALVYHLIFPEHDKVSYSIMAVLYMFVPILSALIVDKLIHKKKSLKSWAMNFRFNYWTLAASPGILLLAFAVLGVNILWPGIDFTPDMSGFWERMSESMTAETIAAQKAQMDGLPVPFIFIAIGQALIAGFTVNALFAFGEEVGWRGFMVREYKHLSFWNASLRIGIVWGLWHAPLILMGHNYPQHPQLGIGMMTIWCILLSPLFLYVRIKSHSTVVAAVMHGTLNATAGLPLMYIAGGSDLTAGFTGFSGFVTLALFIGLLVLYDRKFAKVSITNKTIEQGIGV